MGVFWAWVEGATGNIAVALQSVVEQVRSWVSGVGLQGLGLPSSMDTLNTLLVGWMLFVTLILILGSFFYFKFIHQLDSESDSVSEDAGPKRDPRDREKAGGDKESKAGKSKPAGEPARTPTIVPRQPPSPVSPPVGTGADPDAVTWTNNVFTWLYNSHEGGKVIKKIWLDTVNENTVKTAIDTGILVEVVELLPATPAPVLSNMVVDCSPTDNVTITCDCDATVYLRLVTTRTQGDTTTESEYACAVQPLRGRLNIAALTADMSGVVKFDGWPEVSLKLEGIRNNATGLDEQQMLDVIMEVLTSALRNSVLDIDFKPVPTFPKFRRARQEPDRIIPVGYDSMTSSLPSTTSTQQVGIPGLNGKRLLVKIVKATGVGCEKSVSDAYAVVEMDEPPQKFTTSVAKDTTSPFWDEQFLFDLSGGTLELLFELYDRSDGNFLGLGIVGIEELVATPSQRQIIPLQSRPYENDNVSGSLTVEFLFLDRAEVPEHTVRTSAVSQSVGPKGALVTTTTTTYVKAPEGVDDGGEETTNVSPCPEDAIVNPAGGVKGSPSTYRRRESYRKANSIRSDIIVNGGDGVAAAALRDIEEKKAVVANNASKSTMIIHASRKEVTKRVKQLEEELALEASAGIGTASPTTTPQTSPHHSAPTTTTTTTTAPGSPLTENTTETTESNDTEERGRSRGVRRKRDSFFGTLKKRFSRSKIRSKSMEPGREPSAERDQSVGRSVSMERSTNISRQSEKQPPQTPSSQEQTEPRLLSVPPGVGGGGGDGGSTRSSLSDASAISGSSTRTYINEASMLIIETTENGVYKHYLIPLSLQQKSKWRKKGTKLHIYGEHTFVAKHMSSSTQCEVCGKTMGRRLGKQGYACRDCGYRCHKPCHVKTETTCSSSTVNNMDLLAYGEGDGLTPSEKSFKLCRLSVSHTSHPTPPLPTISEQYVDENHFKIAGSELKENCKADQMCDAKQSTSADCHSKEKSGLTKNFTGGKHTSTESCNKKESLLVESIIKGRADTGDGNVKGVLKLVENNSKRKSNVTDSNTREKSKLVENSVSMIRSLSTRSICMKNGRAKENSSTSIDSDEVICPPSVHRSVPMGLSQVCPGLRSCTAKTHGAMDSPGVERAKPYTPVHLHSLKRCSVNHIQER